MLELKTKNRKTYSVENNKDYFASFPFQFIKEDVNKVNKEYNNTLLTEKSTLEDISGVTEILISKMKDRMLQESFSELSKKALDNAVQASLIMDELLNSAERANDVAIRGGTFADMFNSLEDFSVENARAAIEILRQAGEQSKFLEDFTPLQQSGMSADTLNALRLNTLLRDTGLTLETFAKAIEDGYYEEETGKIAAALQKQMSEGASLFDTGGAGDNGDGGADGVTTRRQKEMIRHNEELLLIREKFINDTEKLKGLEIMSEIKHLKNHKKLLEEEGKDTSAIELKIQKNKVALRNHRRQRDLQEAQDNFDENKHILDTQLAENLINSLDKNQISFQVVYYD